MNKEEKIKMGDKILKKYGYKKEDNLYAIEYLKKYDNNEEFGFIFYKEDKNVTIWTNGIQGEVEVLSIEEIKAINFICEGL